MIFGPDPREVVLLPRSRFLFFRCLVMVSRFTPPPARPIALSRPVFRRALCPTRGRAGLYAASMLLAWLLPALALAETSDATTRQPAAANPANPTPPGTASGDAAVNDVADSGTADSGAAVAQPGSAGAPSGITPSGGSVGSGGVTPPGAEGGAGEVPAPSDPAAKIEFFERQIRPLLVEKCFTCHSAETNSHGGLRVDDRNGLLTGGGRGPALVPGDPEASLMMRAVRRQGMLKMPPQGELDEEQVARLSRWIADGAAWTPLRIPSSLGERNEEYEHLRRTHWAWQPLTRPTPPSVTDATWPADDLDRFILARLEERGLAPVGPADPATLLRRLAHDLTGLPPTPEELAEFLADPGEEAYTRVVDRLLASPRHAEHWARHWLDVARYGESTGSARNLPYPHAWRYRDYVVAAFEADLPFDQFVREQVAGDLLPASSVADKARQLVATGFLAVGVKDVNQRFKVRYLMDNVDEQIDAVTRAFLGLTASCARCHDHKFDPIPQTDYYALAGIFRSTESCDGLRNKMGGGGLDYYDTAALISLSAEPLPQARQEELASTRTALQAAQAELRRVNQSGMADEKTPDGKTRRQVARQQVDSLQQKLLELTDPAQQGPIALGVRDARQVGDTEVRIRGEAEKLGPVVPRGFLGLVPISEPPRIAPRQSGRLELAEWLTDPRNPLTSRVLVNRVWLHLFGRGLVSTPDNFGTTGDPPTHPELLDHLATDFIARGWSVRQLIRRLVLSRTYRLSSQAPSRQLASDPDNTLLWRHAPRRMSAEELRDTALLLAGRLDLQRPTGSPVQSLKVIEIANNGAEARRFAQAARESRQRSLYLPLVRTQTPQALAIWDFAEQGLVTGQRSSTTVAPQALYMLNGEFVIELARELAQRLGEPGSPSPSSTTTGESARRIQRLFQWAYGREPLPGEQERVERYLADYQAELQALIPPIPDRPEPPELPHEGPTPPRPGTPWPAGVEGARDPQERERRAWISLCQAILASAEFRFLR